MTPLFRAAASAPARLAAGAVLFALAGGCATPPAADTQPPAQGNAPPPAPWPPEESPAGSAQPMNFDAALRRALEISPTLRVLESAREAARLSARALEDVKNPELRLAREEGDGSFANARGDIWSERTATADERNNLALRFFPPNPFTLAPERRRARTLIAAADLRIEQEKILIADLIRSAWLSLRYLAADARLAASHAALLDQAAVRLLALSGEGAAPLTEVTDAEQAALRALAAAQKVDEDLHEALSDLAALLHCEPSALLAPREDWNSLPAFDPSALNPDKAGRVAADNAPAPALLALEGEAAREAYAAARRAWIPWFSHVELEYSGQEGRRRAGAGVETTRRRSSDESWGVSLAFELPVFSAFHAAPGLPRAQWASLEQQAALGREARRWEARRAVGQVGRAAERLRLFEEKAGPAAGRLRQLAENLAAPGANQPREQLRVATQLVQLDRQRLLLEYRLRQALLQLETLTGAEISTLLRDEPPAPLRETDGATTP